MERISFAAVSLMTVGQYIKPRVRQIDGAAGQCGDAVPCWCCGKRTEELIQRGERLYDKASMARSLARTQDRETARSCTKRGNVCDPDFDAADSALSRRG